VRLDRLRENAAAAQRAIGPTARLVPMVKADAYGVGMEAAVETLRGAPDLQRPWAFGVAAVAEGERVRSAGWGGRVLVFSPVTPPDVPRAVESGLTLCVSDLAAVRELARAVAGSDRPASFHVEIDTGMGRAGFSWRDAKRWGAEVAAAAGRLRWEGTFTHFHSADEPDLTATDEQYARFREALSQLPAQDPPPVLHVANSGAILRRAGFGCDLARPGIFLYGGRAGPGTNPAAVVSLRARLVLAREVAAGATVGYGATCRAPVPQRWGTLSIGYGDGVARSLAIGGGEVLIRGQRAPIIGRISMDMTTVDLSGIPDARSGDVATLMGTDGDETITVDEVAQRTGTISYEILTRLTGRLPRVYLDGEPEGRITGYY
jgi:alanine racemase